MDFDNWFDRKDNMDLRMPLTSKYADKIKTIPIEEWKFVIALCFDKAEIIDIEWQEKIEKLIKEFENMLPRLEAGKKSVKGYDAIKHAYEVDVIPKLKELLE